MIKYLGIAAILLCTACSSTETAVPEDVISAEQMVPILVDIHLVEGSRNGAIILGDTNKIEDYYAKVYQKYGISDEYFKTSFAYYSGNPEVFIPIYKQVLDSLKAYGTELSRHDMVKNR